MIDIAIQNGTTTADNIGYHERPSAEESLSPIFEDTLAETIVGDTDPSPLFDIADGYETLDAVEVGPTTSHRLLSILADVMEESNLTDVTPASQSATTSADTEDKVALVTDMQLHFIVVGCLFLVVIILSLINLYIHFRSGGRTSSNFIGMKMSGAGSGRGAGAYSMKMSVANKSNL